MKKVEINKLLLTYVSKDVYYKIKQNSQYKKFFTFLNEHGVLKEFFISINKGYYGTFEKFLEIYSPMDWMVLLSRSSIKWDILNNLWFETFYHGTK